MKINHKMKSWIGLVSDFTPDPIKTHSWRMWEYRTLHSGMVRTYGLIFAYEMTKMFIMNHQLLNVSMWKEKRRVNDRH